VTAAGSRPAIRSRGPETAAVGCKKRFGILTSYAATPVFLAL
jgi:hypothetical protein